MNVGGNAAVNARMAVGSSGGIDKDLLIGNYDVDPAEDIRDFTLRPFEARVYRLL